jgi:hypothetical protein
LTETTIIDVLYVDNKALVDYLQQQNEVSLRALADSSLTKSLVLAAASFYETRIKDAIVEFAKENTGNAGLLVEFLKNKALERQYHTFFQWGRPNANQFFSLFGTAFAEHMRKQVEASDGLQRSIAAFMELGELRNRLAHQNYAAFVIDKTAAEIYDLHKRAIEFVEDLPQQLRDFIARVPSVQ